MEYERRSGIDRREQAGLNVRMLAGTGKRRIIRRKEDRDRIFLVDQYSPALFLTILAISFLCIIDALLTLILLKHGAYETNPIMAYLLNLGPYAFFIPKYVLTILGILGLLFFRCIVISKLNVSTHSLLNLMAWLYVSIVAWELYLVSQVA
jgi:hypothetical protein